MHGSIPRGRKVAISVGGRVAAERKCDDGKPVDRTSDGKSAVDDGDWFSLAARSLYPHKPGAILHHTTHLGDERLCQRYASGEVRPPAYFLRALQRSDIAGEQWLHATMDGCTAPWWIQMQHERAVGRAALLAMRERLT